MIRKFEEISNNAWPAIRVLQYDGWILRFAYGVTRRANSIGMLYPSTLDPAVKIARCEAICTTWGIAPCFKVTPRAEPDGIDGVLERAGYRIQSQISFQTADLGAFRSSPDPDVVYSDHPDPRWMDEFIRMNGFDPGRRSTYMDILGHLNLPMTTVSIVRDGKVAAVGLGVAEGQYVGLFDIVVDPGWRQRGLGRRITASLLRWGMNRGAGTAYLQVLCENEPALALYHALGFREIYRYWYRTK